MDDCSPQNGPLHRFLDQCPEATFAIDREGHISYWNPKATERLGIEAKDALGRSLSELGISFPTAPGDFQKFLNWLKLNQRGGPRKFFDVEVANPTGIEIRLQAHATPIESDSRIDCYFSLKRKDEDVEHAHLEQRFKTMFDQSPSPTQIFRPDGSIIAANLAWEKFFATSISQLNGYNALTDPQLEKLGVRSHLARAFQGEVIHIAPFQYDPALIGKIGRVRWLELTAFPIRARTGEIKEVTLIERDVTDQIEAMATLDLVMSTVPALISYIGTDRVYKFANSAYEEWFKLKKEEVIGKHPWDIVGSGFFERIKPLLDTALSGVRTKGYAELEHPKLGPQQMELNFAPDIGPDGKVRGVIVLSLNVTETYRAREKAESLNRVKDEFLATLSHELRTPLNVIIGNAELLKASPVAEADEDASACIDAIYRNAIAQSQIVGDLLDLSSVITGKLRFNPTLISPSDLMDLLLQNMKPTAELKGVSLICTKKGLPRFISADPSRLQQILWNLISNALKFTPAGGKVELSARTVRDSVWFEVTDTGKGITPDFLPHVFDLFRQEDNSMSRAYGGLGLGLSIARKLVELHGGTIEAESQGRGLGAKFTVKLPVSKHVSIATPPKKLANGDAKDAQALVSSGGAKGAQILLVEDSDDNRILITRMLKRAGAEVIEASSPSAARELLKSCQPDLIISDIGMPEENGLQFIRRLRTRQQEPGQHIPAIALTAFARQEEAASAISAGFQKHLAKPVSRETLISAVEEVLGHH